MDIFLVFLHFVDFLFVLHFAFYWFPFSLGQLSLCCVNCIFVVLMLRLFRSLLQFWVFSVKVKHQDLLGLVGLAKDGVGGLKAIHWTYSFGLIVECSPLLIDVCINEIEVENGDENGDDQCWAVLTFFFFENHWFQFFMFLCENSVDSWF